MVWPLLLACASQAPPSENGAAVPIEVCDGVDNDGDGLVDDDDPSLDPESGFLVSYDIDLDSYGAGVVQTRRRCDPVGMAIVDGDCNDRDPAVFPDAPEVCNGVDDDCDGLTDADDSSCDLTTIHLAALDVDEDGYAGTPFMLCGPHEASDATPGDCDDASADVYPGALDLCDGVDNACEGSEAGCVRHAVLAGPYVSAGAAVTSAAFGTDATGSWVAIGSPEAGDYYGGLTGGFAYVMGLPSQSVDAASVATATIDVHASQSTGTGALVRSPGDLDGDGVADLLVEGRLTYSHRGYGEDEGNVSLFLGPLEGELESVWAFEGQQACSDVDGGPDITGDAQPDVVLSGRLVEWTSYELYGVVILDATAEGSLGPDDVPTFLEVSANGILLHPDLDGDGQPDLVLGTSEGTLAVSGPIVPGSAWSDLAPIPLDDTPSGDLVLLPDVDGDGVLDVAAQTGRTVVISGRGGRRAELASDGGSNTATAIDDLDGDGRAEIAVGHWVADLAVSGTGATWIFSGAAEGTVINNDALALLPGSEEYQYLGSALAWTPGTLVIGDATGAWFVDTSTILPP